MVSPTQLCWRYHSLPLSQRYVPQFLVYIMNSCFPIIAKNKIKRIIMGNQTSVIQIYCGWWNARHNKKRFDWSASDSSLDRSSWYGYNIAAGLYSYLAWFVFIPFDTPSPALEKKQDECINKPFTELGNPRLAFNRNMVHHSQNSKFPRKCR